ncbi:hypothetical protein OROMI_001315 [Orobanche minor]
MKLLSICMRGFVRGYRVWECHGEQRNRSGSSNYSVGESSQMPLVREEYVSNYTDMVYDAIHPQFDECEFKVGPDLPNKEAKAFFGLLREANVEIYENSNKTVLGFMAEWLHTKEYKNATESADDGFLRVALNYLVAPEARHLVPDIMYKINRMMEKMSLGYETFDVCTNNCFLYYKEDEALIQCPFCHEARYEMLSSGNYTARKKLWYLPISPRLQRLYMCRKISMHMIWHLNCVDENERIIHPAGAEAWKHFDRTHPSFAAEPRNVRVGLCTEGFNPHSNYAVPYSCWSVFVTPYNLPPDMCMKQEYIFLSLVISVPKSPGKNINVLLRPLIDEFLMLWDIGIETYDSFRKQNFQMRVALLWTISDFPAYGMLSGWSTHGRMSCPICMEETKAFQLVNGGKTSHFDCHRRFLPHDHPFRRNSRDFLRGRVEQDPPIRRRSGAEIQQCLANLQLPSVQFGLYSGCIIGFGKDHNWTKISIFWSLPYWHTLLLPHNLDFMHIEKNFFDNTRHTVMDDPNKTKDNIKARKDLALHTRRRELFLQEDGKGGLLKPKATYTLSRHQNKAICEWLKQVRFPDGYASNISRCVNMQQYHLFGLKSHDCHVLMQRLMPIAFRDFLPENVWGPLTEVSNFFRSLCASEIRASEMEVLEKSIVQTICKLEKIFPPSFFDSMEHLVIHLPYEAKVR